MENTYNFFTEALDLLYSENENGETIETLLETQRKIIIQEKSKFNKKLKQLRTTSHSKDYKTKLNDTCSKGRKLRRRTRREDSIQHKKWRNCKRIHNEEVVKTLSNLKRFKETKRKKKDQNSFKNLEGHTTIVLSYSRFGCLQIKLLF
jgi:hypothetical protein